MSKKKPRFRLFLAEFTIMMIITFPMSFAIDPPTIISVIFTGGEILPALIGILVVVLLSVASATAIRFLILYVERNE